MCPSESPPGGAPVAADDGSTVLVSVIVRTFDSVATVGETIASVRGQDLEAEIIVVDSGSTDGTLELVGPVATRVVHVHPDDFTYGGALNTGAAAATGVVHVALSSHCVLPRPDWLRIAVEHVVEGRADAVVGMPTDADGTVLSVPFTADHAYLMDHMHWGLSNHASAWSAETWRRHRFAEDLAATEDKEWSWRALAPDGRLVADPRLVVPAVHRRSPGVRSYFRRLVKEMGAVTHLRPLPPFGPRRAAVDWLRGHPRDPFLSGSRRMGRTRLVEVGARYVAGRRARARSTPPRRRPPDARIDRETHR